MRCKRSEYLKQNSEKFNVCRMRMRTPSFTGIIQDTLTLSGASPPSLGHPPIAMTTYYLQPDWGTSQCAPSPNGGKTALFKEPAGEEHSGSSTWWRKRGASFHIDKDFNRVKKKIFYRQPSFF
jgi:hypothetical protein